MKRLLYLILFIFGLTSFLTISFKESQKKYSRVQEAYKEKESTIIQLLKNKSLDVSKLEIYIRVFKDEDILELWGKNSSEVKFQLIKTYEICEKSGDIGPKRKQGDFQVPEGFYHIDRFNPLSNFYLSMGINYPNKSDRILGKKGNLGGDIFIHGNCVTIGCIPLTDNFIKELYIYCVEAKNNGQNNIPVTIFPAKLTDAKLKELSESIGNKESVLMLWKSLQKGYVYFNKTNTLPTINVLNNGEYEVSKT